MPAPRFVFLPRGRFPCAAVRRHGPGVVVPVSTLFRLRAWSHAAFTRSSAIPRPFATGLDPAAAVQSDPLRPSGSAHRIRERVGLAVHSHLSRLDLVAPGPPAYASRLDCSVRARLASGCVVSLCRTGCGACRTRWIASDDFSSLSYIVVPPSSTDFRVATRIVRSGRAHGGAGAGRLQN